MFFSYTASVILVSLAMFGIWCFIKDLWTWLLQPQLVRLPSVTFLIMVKDIEQDIEEMMRYLMREIESSDVECDAVVVDCNSDDLTPAILVRLAHDLPGLTIHKATGYNRPIAEAVPYCRGTVIHVLDVVNRLNCDEFMVAVCSLMRQSCNEVAIRQRD
ncbi:hypothetical protein [Dendrosporobacter sp. 1207_IL3150]|uniref:hypothetical protein n=1 Tax=Dendrosporobacter sp. 1207_IL3150 TaxID=3084054 RepID=UPI002FD9D969